MNKMLTVVLFLGVVLIGVYLYLNTRESSEPLKTTSNGIETEAREISVVAENLDTPWELVFLPEGDILVTERSGQVRYISPDGNLSPQPLAVIADAQEIGEGGLLGMTLHPNFSENGLIYFYYTYSGNDVGTQNRVVRMTYRDNTLSNEEIIIDTIPGAQNHNGGRIAFGPDGFLYVTTGDAQAPSLAQNTDSLAGKILRVTDTGEPAPGNPFENRVYSYGHRNVQGLAWDREGKLWATEHGRSGIQSGFDEVNVIVNGGNYGWPDVEGEETQTGMIAPIIQSGSSTWAPAGAVVYADTLAFVGLRGSSLYEATIQGNNLDELHQLFENTYGRLRVVALSPDNYLYIATSNQDGRGTPSEGDDKIVKIPLK